jgi:hypothetical protein
MAHVIGPNGAKSFIPDDVASCLVGEGDRGHTYAEPDPAPSQTKRAPRRTAKTSE